MKKWTQLSRALRETHPAVCRLWTVFGLTALGCCIGLLSLACAAAAYPILSTKALFFSYFRHPLLVALNLLPGVLLIWLFYFLTLRGWAAFLLSFLPVIGLSVANYYKIRLRSDPLLASDLLLAAEAGNIVQGYTLDATWVILAVPVCLVLGLLFARILLPRGPESWRGRALGTASCLALLLVSMPTLFTNEQIYAATANTGYINPWSDVQVFVSRGGIYPFLYSVKGMLPTPPQGYDQREAAALLAQYPDEDIPEARKVSVAAVMLEAFCDLTDFPQMAALEPAAQVYEPWHRLEEEAVSGRLLTNIFAGGTVDSEWAFLTGYSTCSPFRSPTDSYVWYFDLQGYQTFGSHPGHDWFYNRKNINEYLGFSEYWFSENHYEQLMDTSDAAYDSDRILFSSILEQLEDRVKDGPCFSFSVSLQNHGPYEELETLGENYLTPGSSGCSQETCNIWNNYLNGVSLTVQAIWDFTRELEELEGPVVLVLFGDHKPWGGNGNSAYTEIMGAPFDLSSLQGFGDYYATPYLIWANSAAKAALDRPFTGEGGTFSPCLLMEELFDQCGWTGPGFMRLSRQLRQVTPLVHSWGLYLQDGTLTDILPEADALFLQQFLAAQFYREHEITPAS